MEYYEPKAHNDDLKKIVECSTSMKKLTGRHICLRSSFSSGKSDLRKNLLRRSFIESNKRLQQKIN